VKAKRPFLVFVNCGTLTGRTFIWNVVNKDGYQLGSIRWHVPWRRYCFYPDAQSIWDRNCLMEIVEFIDKEMTRRNPNHPHPKAHPETSPV
jgi:hypothetical protein